MTRIIMMEGNTLARQRDGAALGVRNASAVYSQAIQAHFPDIGIDVIHAADRDQGLPPGARFEDYDGLVVGGSGLRANDQTFEVTNQIELLKAFSQTGKPILGSCWGLQIAALAAGGDVAASPKGREFGFARKVRLTEAGESHAFFRGKPQVFDAPCIHFDEVTRLPSDAVVLCGNAHSAVQGAVFHVAHSPFWGVQYHPEFDLPQLAMLVKLYGGQLIQEGFFQTETEHLAFQEKLNTLAADPANAAIAWQLGVDGDILSDTTRRAEIINWVETQLLQHP